MNNENEVIMLILSVFALLFIIFYRKDLRRVRGHQFLITSFLLFFAACIFTNFEALIWGSLLNVLEHLSYLFSVIIMFFWTYRYLIFKRVTVKHD